MAKKGSRKTKPSALTTVSVFVLVFIAGMLLRPIVFPEPSEYKIGLTVDLSKAGEGDVVHKRDAALLAVEEINELLAVGGSKARFTVVQADTSGTREGASAAINSLKAQGVKVVVGPFSSGELNEAKGLCDAGKIVCISPLSTSPNLEVAGDYVFRMSLPYTHQANALARLVGERGYTKAAVIARSDDFGKGLANKFKEKFVGEYDGRVEVVLYSPEKEDFTQEVKQLGDKVIGLGVDEHTTAILLSFGDDGFKIISEAAGEPTLSKVKWFGSSTLKKTSRHLKGYPPEVGEFLADVELTGVLPSSTGGPITRDFEEAYTERFGTKPLPNAYVTYDATRIACLAVLGSGAYEGESIAKILPKVSANYVGASGYKTLNKDGDLATSSYDVWEVESADDGVEFKDLGGWAQVTGWAVKQNP